jgi:hypothetical protein
MRSARRHAIRVTAQRFKLDACDLLAGGLEGDREFERSICTRFLFFAPPAAAVEVRRTRFTSHGGQYFHLGKLLEEL